ncbi:MAG: DNA cytosine methyltransferase [Thermoplasmata archaeon]
MRPSLVVDLFSGTGSATEPWVRCGAHRVVHVDISPKFHPDIRADVNALPGFLLRERPYLVTAGPPCTEFSELTKLREYWPGKLPANPRIGMILIRATIRAIGQMRPAYYVIENVRGAVPYVSTEIGPHSVAWAGRYLWTNAQLGLLSPPTRFDRKGGRNPTLREAEARRLLLERLRRARLRNTLADRSTMRSMWPRTLAEGLHTALCDRDDSRPVSGFPEGCTSPGRGST